MEQKKNKNNNSLLYQYAGLATQFLVSIGLAVFLGLKADKWLSFKAPILIWLLPLLVIGVMTWQIIKDTSKK